VSRAVCSYKFGEDRNSKLNYYADEALSCFKGEATISVFLGIKLYYFGKLKDPNRSVII